MSGAERIDKPTGAPVDYDLTSAANIRRLKDM